MGTVLHKDLLATENHKIQYWTWASSAAKDAQVVSASDIGKVGYQTDTMQFYILTNWSPATWSPLSGYTAAAPVRAQYAASTAQTCANATPINFDTKVVDTDNAVTAGAAGVTGTWKFTCPPGKGGTYQINGSLVFNGAHTVNLAKNGAIVRNLCTAIQNGYGISFSTTIDLAPGDFISLWGTGGLATIAGVANNHVEITRVPDSGVAAGQTISSVFVQAARVAAQSVGTASTLIQYDTEYSDSHGCFTTGASARFTCSVAGVYSVKALLSLSAAGTGMSIGIYKNGTLQLEDAMTSWMASVTGDVILAVGDYVEIKARSWSGTSPNFTSNLQITRYADQAVAPSIAGYSPVMAEYCSSASPAVGAGAQINWETKLKDSDNAVTVGSAWKFTCPAGKGGRYQISMAIVCSAVSNASLYKNGALVRGLLTTTTGNNKIDTATTQLDLLPGDYVDVRLSLTATLSNNPSYNWVQIQSVSTYAIPDQAKPSAKYVQGVAQSVGAGSIINFETKKWDSHNAVTVGAAWKYTAPLAGKYRVTATTRSNAASALELVLYKNGVMDSQLGWNASWSVSGATLVELAAGDYIDIRSAVAFTTNGSGIYTQVEIEYLGQ